MRTFYTDGSNRNNGKPNSTGAWSWVEIDEKGEMVQEFASSVDDSGVVPTNIRMEMMGVIAALHECNPEDEVAIISDSAYVINGMNNKWYVNWFIKGLNTSGKVPANLDLWRVLVRSYSRLKKVTFTHVKGHSGNINNERCDELAFSLSAADQGCKTYHLIRE